MENEEIIEYNTFKEFISRYPRITKFDPKIEEMSDSEGNPLYKIILTKCDPVISTTFNSNVLGLLVHHKVPNPEDKFYEILAVDLYKQLYKNKFIDELPEWLKESYKV